MIDELDGILSEVALLIRGGHSAEALLELCKAQGVTATLLNDINKWNAIRIAYESGVTPKQLGLRFSVTQSQISSKAWRENWTNPRKAAKEASIRKKKYVIHVVCQQCELYFETDSGHSKVCPTCKALENMGKRQA